jgi:hypothetical protein
MFSKISDLIRSKKTAMSFLFTGLFSLVANAQEEDQQSAVVNYGEHHPMIFIILILLVVGGAVVGVYYVFNKNAKKQAAANPPVGFSKPGQQRTARHPADRRNISKKSIPR